ncbi:Acyl-CoA thioester hydrolase YbgC [Chlamydia abortus]|uniref:Acyl-CoA thioesterase n=1 Tax=Paenibacillus residui TaxID=629724 RepID=A0ABW3DCY4_9BACL|nr:MULTISPECIES: thioesterase family protein [Paenibacillaceae]SHE09882.1 Acyl-CoA thioester hydrolase YbgC [Chlamydia abortus]
MNRWHVHSIRVRYEETDQMGVVYHANYLTWFEIGRTEMIRETGFTYRELEANRLLLPLVEASMKFKQPARYDDEVAIYTRMADVTPISIVFESQVRRAEGGEAESGRQADVDDQPEGELLVSGMTKHIWVNPEWKPVRLDRQFPELYERLPVNR